MWPGSLTIAKLAHVCYITFSSDLRAEVQGWISLPDTSFKIFEKDLFWKWKFLFTRESLLPHGVFNLPLCNVVSHWHGKAGLAWQESLDSFYVLHVSTAGAIDCLLLEMWVQSSRLLPVTIYNHISLLLFVDLLTHRRVKWIPALCLFLLVLLLVQYYS